MTVTNTTNRSDQTGDGAAVAFPFTLKYFKTSDLDVFIDDVLQTEVTNYSVSPASGDSGTVTFVVAPASGAKVAIIISLPRTQSIDLPVAGKFPADSVEEGLDRTVMLYQEMENKLNKKAGIPDSSTINPALPLPVAGLESFRWNAAKTAIELYTEDNSVLTALGDIIVGTGASPANKKLAIGTEGQVLQSVSADLAYRDKGDLERDVKFSGDISPASFGADQNDLNPTGLATASTLRLTSSVAINITGLQGGADGRIIIIHNIGTFQMTLVDSSASSAAANRFDIGDNVLLAASTSVMLRYDATTSRWRLASGAGGGGAGVSFAYFIS